MSEEQIIGSPGAAEQPVSTLLGVDLANAIWEYLWFHDGARTHHVGRRFKLATPEARKIILRLERDDRVERSERYTAVNDIYWIAKRLPADGPKGQDGIDQPSRDEPR